MPDEHICRFCEKFSTCLERKKVEDGGDIIIECAIFEEINDE
jgi:hypothetical protein